MVNGNITSRKNLLFMVILYYNKRFQEECSLLAFIIKSPFLSLFVIHFLQLHNHQYSIVYILQNTYNEDRKSWVFYINVEMFYLNTIEQVFLSVEQLDQLEVCLPHSRLLTGIAILAVFQNLRWYSNKTSLLEIHFS